jgi:hypothetical protein
MRLAPVPLFFRQHPEEAIEFSGYSGQITHGNRKAYDACRYYGALIVAALKNYAKDQLLDKDFYKKHQSWFGDKPLCDEIRMIAEGSYKTKGGYEDGIRGNDYIVNALEAALWAFWSDENKFEKGVLAAVNLGDDTDTTAAIYGQLAGAYYGYKSLPKRWVEQVYAKKYILQLSKWIAYEGNQWKKTEVTSSSNQLSVGTVSSASVDDLSTNESTTTNRHYLQKTSSGTLPSRRKTEYNVSPSPPKNPSSSSASAQNPSYNNDKNSDQHPYFEAQSDSNTAPNISQKPIIDEQRPPKKTSTPINSRKKK